MKKDDIIEFLESNVCTLKFQKVNGEKRTMKCTLLKSLIPEEVVAVTRAVHPAETRHPQLAERPETIAVWDIEKSGWRSFRVNLFESIETTVVEEKAK